MDTRPLFIDLREPQSDEDTRASLAEQELERRVAQQSEAITERSRVARDERKLIISTYHAVWKELYDWEPEACCSLIRSLAADNAGGASTYDDVIVPFDDCDVAMEVELSEGVMFEIFDFEEGQRAVLGCECECEREDIITTQSILQPKYEACTPSMQVLRADESWSIQFVQYAGEPGFDERSLIELYRSLSWQDTCRDPDESSIMIETVTRLEMSFLSYDVLDGHQILAHLQHREKNGLLWRMSQRDPWQWAGASAVLPVPPVDYDSDNLVTRLNEYVNALCPHMGCLQHLCLTHKEPTSPLHDVEPHIKADALGKDQRSPCGLDCFLQDQDTHEDSTASEPELIQQILSIFPDELPCNLALICRLPCYQIHMKRCQLYPDQDIIPESRHKHLQPTVDHFIHEIYALPEEQPPGIDFCDHLGPCGFQCPCYQAKQHCKRNCRCNKHCRLRHPGCRCKASSSACTNDCICFQNGRECDPEVCGPSRLRRKGIKHKCGNTGTQQQEYPHLQIGTSEHGQGMFAFQNSIPKGKIVGEYIAELFYHPSDPDKLDFLYKHRGLNYTFTLNKDQVEDAAYVGNETRYMNHTKDKANVETIIKWVDGEHRIAFYATKKIKAGQEIMFDYGDKFWNA